MKQLSFSHVVSSIITIFLLPDERLIKNFFPFKYHSKNKYINSRLENCLRQWVEKIRSLLLYRPPSLSKKSRDRRKQDNPETRSIRFKI